MLNQCYIILLLVIIVTSEFVNIFSYLEKNYKYAHQIRTLPIIWELELMYTESHLNIKLQEDSICILSDEKKWSLCNLIFSLQVYKDQDIYLNKAPFYVMKLPCKYHKLSFEFFNDLNKINSHKMYQCPGRHRNVRTSFIEDDLYNVYYLSDGPYFGSVTVYINKFDSYFIYDYIFNINILNLKELKISKRNVINELKMNRNIFSVPYNEMTMYLNEGNYYDVDPICDLAYEKKISLCNIVFNQNMYKNVIKVTLNKTAAYILNMACEVKQIHFSTEIEEKLIVEKNVYPCYARAIDITTSNNLLVDQFIETFYLSNGPKRNSVIVYFLSNFDKLGTKIYNILELIGNINIQNLKPTIITEEELETESLPTYTKVQELIYSIEEKYQNDFKVILAASYLKVTVLSEIEIIQKMIKEPRLSSDEIILQEIERKKRTVLEKFAQSSSDTEFNLDISKQIENEDIESKIKEIDHKEKQFRLVINIIKEIDSEKKKIRKSINLSDMSEFVQVGLQVYGRLLDKLKRELVIEQNVDEMKWKVVMSKRTKQLKKKIGKLLYKQPKIVSKNEDVYRNVQKMIEDMKLYVLNKNRGGKY